MIKEFNLEWNEEIIPKFLHAHSRYTIDGNWVPGVTTITGLLDKSGPLMYWAWDLGRQGLDYRKVKDRAANIGTIAHGMIKIHLLGILLKRSDADVAEMIKIFGKDYAPAEMDKAENAYIAYLDFAGKHKLIPKLLEVSLLNEKHGYGGTIDWYGQCDGVWELQDFKTGKRIYDSYVVQVAAYWKSLIDEGLPVDQVRMLRLGKEDGEFEPTIITKTDLENGWKTFAGLRFAYEPFKAVQKRYK